MVETNAALLAALGIVSAFGGALIWIIKYQFTQVKPALDFLAKSNTALAKATEQNTRATKAADEYLRQRNGQDKEFHTEVMRSLDAIPIHAKLQADIVANELKRVGDVTAAQLKLVPEQHVQEQVVHTQVIDERKDNTNLRAASTKSTGE